MFFVGDVHGIIGPFLNILERRVRNGPCLQVGDMGLGFGGVSLPELKPQHRFIRGNHDDPAACKAHPSYAGEFGYWEEHRLFFLGGAWSIDLAWRKAWNAMHSPKKVWWEDEELSPEQLEAAYQLYIKVKPELVGTHEAPTEAAKYVLRDGFRQEKAECANTRTSQALQRMFEAHQPRHWVFGHYHRTIDFRLGSVDGQSVISTRFHCLTELDLGEWE